MNEGVGEAEAESKAKESARTSAASNAVQEWIALVKEVQFRNFIENQTFGTICLFVVSFCQTFVGLVAGKKVAAHFVLSPAKVGLTDFQIWTLLTASYYEAWLIKYVLMMGACLPCAYHVEKVWGWKKFTAYVLAVNLGSAFVSSALKVFLYLTVDETYLFADIYGLGGVFMSVLVALAVTCGDRLTPVPPVQVRHLPLCFLVISFLTHSALTHVSDFFLTCFSLCLSIMYLMRFPINNNVAEMTVDALFPTALRPYILAVALLVCRRSASASQATRTPTPTVMPRTLGSDPVSERRRARALKALDRKLAEISNEPEISLDGEDLEADVQTP